MTACTQFYKQVKPCTFTNTYFLISNYLSSFYCLGTKDSIRLSQVAEFNSIPRGCINGIKERKNTNIRTVVTYEMVLFLISFTDASQEPWCSTIFLFRTTKSSELCFLTLPAQVFSLVLFSVCSLLKQPKLSRQGVFFVCFLFLK